MNSHDSRLTGSNIDQTIDGARTKLTQWRDHCRQTIDEFYQRKLQELDTYSGETKRQYENSKAVLQNYLTQLKVQQEVDGGDSTQIDSNIKAIQQGLDDLEQTSIEIALQPFALDDNSICIGKKFDLRHLSSFTSTFPYSQASSSAIASNEQFLLMHRDRFLCLFDQNRQLVKQSAWDHGWIHDMCWSATLRCFFIVTCNKVFLTEEQISTIVPVEGQFNHAWFSCTCSDKSLYLSTREWGSSIYEYQIAPSLDLVHQWKSPTTCDASEGVNDVKYKNGKLALVIKDSQSHQRRIALKLASTFHTVWTLSLDASTNIRLLTCCPLKHNDWLFIDGANSQIIHITHRGTIKERITSPLVPYRANLFGSRVLVVANELVLGFLSIPH